MAHNNNPPVGVSDAAAREIVPAPAPAPSPSPSPTTTAASSTLATASPESLARSIENEHGVKRRATRSPPSTPPRQSRAALIKPRRDLPASALTSLPRSTPTLPATPQPQRQPLEPQPQPQLQLPPLRPQPQSQSQQRHPLPTLRSRKEHIFFLARPLLVPSLMLGDYSVPSVIPAYSCGYFYNIIRDFDPDGGTPLEFVHLLANTTAHDLEVARALLVLDRHVRQNPFNWRPRDPQYRDLG
ncbi:hypothetical protein GGR58DRAFT_502475 [Xylaria digitata]|nr:hypothetical protein GGR58DRAFT_502475 [Xylaria digitata]